MKGEHQVVVRNNRLQIKLTVRRNLTILQGNSATGKTTLLDLIAQYDEMGRLAVSSLIAISPAGFSRAATGSATFRKSAAASSS